MIYLVFSMTQRRFLFFFLVFLFITVGGYFLINFAKGYKFDFSKKSFRATGLLVATSLPDGAQIYINGKLTSATNNTISLSPNIYDVEIKKDGYASWRKLLKIERELVVKTDAWLFPLVPDFRALTFTGAANPLLSTDGTKIVYPVSGTQTPERNGLWVLDLSDLPFGISRDPKQIIKSSPQGRDFSKATLAWSPDSRQILATLPQGKRVENFLLDASNLNPATQLVDITENLATTKQQWQKEEDLEKEQRLKKLPEAMMKIITEKGKNVVFSPDEIRVLYTVSDNVNLPEAIISPVPGSSNQPQERNLIPNRVYIYDIKEDRNFFVAQIDTKDLQNCKLQAPTLLISCSSTLTWFPTSRHLLLTEKDKIQVMEYDGANKITVYAGTYQLPFAFPSPDGTKLILLTTLSSTPDSSPNLYAVKLR